MLGIQRNLILPVFVKPLFPNLQKIDKSLNLFSGPAIYDPARADLHSRRHLYRRFLHPGLKSWTRSKPGFETVPHAPRGMGGGYHSRKLYTVTI